MKISILIKYMIVFCIIIILASMLISIYTYFEIGNKNINIIYKIIVPVAMLIISFLYSKKIKNNGWIRGAEIWIAYFIIINIMKYFMNIEFSADIYRTLLYLPVCLLGGIIGVNIK